jgi:methylmalonyl-CoA mutase
LSRDGGPDVPKDRAIATLADVSLYVMRPEFGAPSQLEKIDMLDLADVVAINEFERRGAQDALRDVARQVARNREQFGVPWQDMPVFGTCAARFDDDGVTALYHHLKQRLGRHGLPSFPGALAVVEGRTSTGLGAVPQPRPGALPRRKSRRPSPGPRRVPASRRAAPTRRVRCAVRGLGRRG